MAINWHGMVYELCIGYWWRLMVHIWIKPCKHTRWCYYVLLSRMDLGKGKMKAYILGCSHAAGSEISEGTTKSYPAVIANALGYQAINLSIPGGSNDAMFRLFEELVDLKKIHYTDIFVACWTGSQRTEIQHNNDWHPLSVGDQTNQHELYKKHWITYDSGDWKWRLNKIKNIIALNTIAKLQGISVFNIDSFNNIEGFKGFDLYTEYNWPVHTLDFVGWCEQNTYDRTEMGHYNESAHKDFGNLVVSYVKEKTR